MQHILPGYNYGYRIVQIDDHPWDYLLTMKELVKLEPGRIEFVGAAAVLHTQFWQKELPQYFEGEGKPVFKVDTTLIHPHAVESAPREPFRPWHSQSEVDKVKPIL